jgi:hypothetical protein
MGIDVLLEQELAKIGMPMTAPLSAEDLRMAAELDDIGSSSYKNTEEILAGAFLGTAKGATIFQNEVRDGQVPAMMRQSLIKNGFGVEYRMIHDGSEEVCVEFSKRYVGAEGFDAGFYNQHAANFLFTMSYDKGKVAWDNSLETEPDFDEQVAGNFAWKDYAGTIKLTNACLTPESGIALIGEFLAKYAG